MAVLPAAASVAVALVHGLFVAVLVLGPVAVARRPRTARLHLPVVLAMAAVTLTGSDCPLTTLEKHLREAAGWGVYDTGFISHYLVEPWHPAGITSGVRLLVIAGWILPNIVGYAVAAARLRSRDQPAVGNGSPRSSRSSASGRPDRVRLRSRNRSTSRIISSPSSTVLVGSPVTDDTPTRAR